MQGYKRIAASLPEYSFIKAWICPKARVLVINTAAAPDANLIAIRLTIE